MKKDDLKVGVALRMEVDRQPAQAQTGLAPAPTKRPRGTNLIRVAKIDPENRRAAVVVIPASMRTVRQMVGKKVGEQLLTSVDGIHVRVACETIGTGKVWRVRGSLPIRGKAILYGFAGYGPSDFPADNAWLKRMIEFDVEVDRVVNQLREEKS